MITAAGEGKPHKRSPMRSGHGQATRTAPEPGQSTGQHSSKAVPPMAGRSTASMTTTGGVSQRARRPSRVVSRSAAAITCTPSTRRGHSVTILSPSHNHHIRTERVMDLADLGPRPRTVRCLKCGKRVRVKPLGGIPMYCSASCRQHVFRKRHRQPKPMPMTDAEYHRRQLWEALVEFGLTKGPMPPKPKQEDET